MHTYTQSWQCVRSCRCAVSTLLCTYTHRIHTNTQQAFYFQHSLHLSDFHAAKCLWKGKEWRKKRERQSKKLRYQWKTGAQCSLIFHKLLTGVTFRAESVNEFCIHKNSFATSVAMSDFLFFFFSSVLVLKYPHFVPVHLFEWMKSKTIHSFSHSICTTFFLHRRLRQGNIQLSTIVLSTPPIHPISPFNCVSLVQQKILNIKNACCQ